jgi:hypothetical protein
MEAKNFMEEYKSKSSQYHKKRLLKEKRDLMSTLPEKIKSFFYQLDNNYSLYLSCNKLDKNIEDNPPNAAKKKLENSRRKNNQNLYVPIKKTNFLKQDNLTTNFCTALDRLIHYPQKELDSVLFPN